MSNLPIIDSAYILYKELISLNQELQKNCRFTIGKSSEVILNSLLEQLIYAKHAPITNKATYLNKASVLTELFGLKIRLMLELKLANETRLFQLNAKLEEIGRMLGGWLKSL